MENGELKDRKCYKNSYYNAVDIKLNNLMEINNKQVNKNKN